MILPVKQNSPSLAGGAGSLNIGEPVGVQFVRVM